MTRSKNVPLCCVDHATDALQRILWSSKFRKQASVTSGRSVCVCVCVSSVKICIKNINMFNNPGY